MDYDEIAEIRYQQMCNVVGRVVLEMAAKGYETRRFEIANVIRMELVEGIDKWNMEELQVLHLSVKLLEE